MSRDKITEVKGWTAFCKILTIRMRTTLYLEAVDGEKATPIAGFPYLFAGFLVRPNDFSFVIRTIKY